MASVGGLCDEAFLITKDHSLCSAYDWLKIFFFLRKNLLESEKTSGSALSGVVRIEIWPSFYFAFLVIELRSGM